MSRRKRARRFARRALLVAAIADDDRQGEALAGGKAELHDGDVQRPARANPFLPIVGALLVPAAVLLALRMRRERS